MADPTASPGDKGPADVALCTCAGLRRATRAVSQLYDAALRPSGLKATQFNVLAILAEGGPVPQARLADMLVMERTTLIRNLRPLARDGLVEVSGRGVEPRVVALTPAGNDAYRRALPYWESVQTAFADALGAGRWERLTEDLGRVVEAARPS